MSLRAALGLVVAIGSTPVSAEVAATSHLGFAIRNVSYVEATSGAAKKSVTDADSFSGPIVCQEVSAPLGLKSSFVSGGCALVGGFWTFALSTSMFLGMQYYPSISIPTVGKDDSLRLRSATKSRYYVSGFAAITKITHDQLPNSSSTLTADVLELGPGAGYQYQISNSMTLGADARVTFGTIVSKAASGTSFGVQFSPNFRVVF
jgi:hypothetical protein